MPDLDKNIRFLAKVPLFQSLKERLDCSGISDAA